MPSSRHGPTSPPPTSAPRTFTPPTSSPHRSARRGTDPGPQVNAEATSRGRLAAEALRWACHAAGLVLGPARSSPLTGQSLRSLTKRLSRGAAETAIRVALRALAAAGREVGELPSYGDGRPYFCPYEKALASLDFSLRAGFGSLAIPSKLVGVRAHQEAIRRLKASGARLGTRLCFRDETGGLAVTTRDGAVLGYVQTKHEVWIRALLSRDIDQAGERRSEQWRPDESSNSDLRASDPKASSLTSLSFNVCLLAVTGDGMGDRLHGVNVAFVGSPPESWSITQK